MKKKTVFSRVLIVLLMAFIVALLIASFTLGESRFLITNETILLVLLLILLALSEVFDSFSIGDLITVKKEKHEKEIELKESKTENKELRTQLMNIVSNTIANRNMNVIGFTKNGWMQLGAVEQAEESAVEEKKEEDFEAGTKSSADDFRKRRKIMSNIEELAFKRFCLQYKIPALSVVRDVKFSDEFIGIDPIMDRNAVFDGYYKSLQEELFVEIKFAGTVSGMNLYNLYYLLSKIYYYSKANQLRAKMVLIIPNLPESYPNLPESYGRNRLPYNARQVANIQKYFAPAIKSDLLEIANIEITEQDLEAINQKSEE